MSQLHLVHGQDREASGDLCPTVAEAEESAFRQVGASSMQNMRFRKLALLQNWVGPELPRIWQSCASSRSSRTHQPYAAYPTTPGQTPKLYYDIMCYIYIYLYKYIYISRQHMLQSRGPKVC